MSALTAVVFGVVTVLTPVSATAATFQAVKLATGLYDASKAIPVASSLSSGAMVVARANPWGAAITMGLTLASIYVATNDKSTEFMLRAANSPRSIPDGWTANPTDPANPLPPPSAVPTYKLTGGTSGSCFSGIANVWTGVSPSQAASNYAVGCGWTNVVVANAGSSQCPTSVPIASASYYCTVNSIQGQYGYYSQGIAYQSSPSCATGYTLSGTTCNLSSATAVPMPSEGLPYVQPTTDGTGWTTDPRRPDIRPTSVPATGPYTLNGLDGAGNPVQLTLTPSTSGMQVDLLQQSMDALNNTITQANHLTLNNAGQVTALSQDTKPGAITQYSTTNTTITNTTTTNNSAPVDMTATNAKLDTLHQDITTAPASNPTLQNEKTALDTAANDHKTAIDNLGNKGQDNENGLLSWQFQSMVVQEQCSDPSFSVLGKSITITGYCDKVMMVRSLFGWVLYVLTYYTLQNIIMNRKEED